MTVAGLVLAAGAGSRFGAPKLLARDADGTSWAARAISVLRGGGCSPLLIAVGAERERALVLLGDLEVAAEVAALPVLAWEDGISASILAGLDALGSMAEVEAAVIVPVDVPSLSDAMVRRVLAAATDQPLPGALRQAVFSGRPGHPVLVGRDHWIPLRQSLSGDSGARRYLVAHGVQEIECSDLGSGADVDERV